ncbi:unnamed protein product [Cylicostephanus goldi]|uniref:Uncharacterized protein n=1 Tax=Cylicostephanus goldi TaxID=71465 RepID=A0A3P6R6T8_CYLGO|nr:unnamed protein product [Cylicostephanus goldi]
MRSQHSLKTRVNVETQNRRQYEIASYRHVQFLNVSRQPFGKRLHGVRYVADTVNVHIFTATVGGHIAFGKALSPCYLVATENAITALLFIELLYTR